MTEIIKLNVGGKILQSKKSILCQSKYFDTLLNKYDSKDEIFIDDDSKLFVHILNKLRNANYEFPEKYINNLMVMSEYYQLPIIEIEQVENKEIEAKTIKSRRFNIRKHYLHSNNDNIRLRPNEKIYSFEVKIQKDQISANNKNVKSNMFNISFMTNLDCQPLFEYEVPQLTLDEEHIVTNDILNKADIFNYCELRINALYVPGSGAVPVPIIIDYMLYSEQY